MFKIVITDEARDTIDALPLHLKLKIFDNIELLSEFGNKLKKSYVEAFGGGLFELRTKGVEGIARAFFTYDAGKIVIIFHAFVKKTQKTPNNELERARKILKELKDKK